MLIFLAGMFAGASLVTVIFGLAVASAGDEIDYDDYDPY